MSLIAENKSHAETTAREFVENRRRLNSKPGGSLPIETQWLVESNSLKVSSQVPGGLTMLAMTTAALLLRVIELEDEIAILKSQQARVE